MCIRDSYEYVRDEETITRIAAMQARGVALVEPRTVSTEDQTLTGKAVVVTGAVEGYSRDDVAAAIVARGGTCPGSVSGKTYVVVVGEAPGMNKVTKAREVGVPLISAAQFEELLATGAWSTTLE